MVRSRHIFSWVLLSFSLSFGATAAFKPTVRIVPLKNETLQFCRSYSSNHLKNHPLQFVKKTCFALKNSNGLLTGKWDATIRDIRTDESVEASATALCKVAHSSQLTCRFDASTGTANLTREANGIRILIPVGQGILMQGEKDDNRWSEILLGADDDNHTFRLDRKSR
jgi:hypothetical protein